jgi:hypothetical protein
LEMIKQRFGRDEVLTAITHAANVWASPDRLGQRWLRVAELHSVVGMAHLSHGQPLLPLVQFVDGLSGGLLSALLPPQLRRECDDVTLLDEGALSAAAADLLMENLGPVLSADAVASWTLPRLAAEKVQGWLYGQLLATGSEDGYRRARQAVIDNAAGPIARVIDAIKTAGLPRDGLVESIPAWAWVAHEGERYWFACPVCRYPMRAQRDHVACCHPPHEKAAGGAMMVRLRPGQAPKVGAWNTQRVAAMGGTDTIAAAKVDGHVCLVRPAWRYSVVPGCEELRLHRILNAIPDVTATLWPYTDRYDLHVVADGRRQPWRVDVKDYTDSARLASELLRRGTLNDPGLLIVVPDHRGDQVGVLNERLRRELATRRLFAVTSARFIKMVTDTVKA